MKGITIFVFAITAFLLLAFPVSVADTSAKQKTDITFELEVENGKTINFSKSQICLNKDKQNKFNTSLDNQELAKTAKKIKQMGFSDAQTVQFLFPGIEQVFDGLENKINTTKKDAEISFNSHNGTFEIKNEIIGKSFNREETSKNILNYLQKSNKIKTTISIDKINPEKTKNNLKNYCNKKSEFSTWCGSSSDDRKHNIQTACNSISGTKIEKGETFSFNNATGVRNQAAGYRKAKIISNGTYKEGFGGGVCQVSTTLYNAALLAGLQIDEAHQHSLAVSYVGPSRDAMVSGSSADLKITNNTDGPIFIRARLVNSENVVIEIFGEKNKLNYEINSKIIKTIPKQNDEIIYTNKIGDEYLLENEEKIVSYAKDGIVSEAYLKATDKYGKLIYNKKIRTNTYNPTRGVVAKNKPSN